MQETIKQRVALGARILDEKCPGWREKIDLANFALTGCRQCVLGQLYGLYTNGIHELGICDAAICGFVWEDQNMVSNVEPASRARNKVLEIQSLTEAWKREITR